ncbi:MAG: acyl-CoA dehydrogenase [Gammaproteobacteria bacterium]|nr:acyl-CoA dehydrogenase [Gammaproteobacteria bacterium]
MTALTWILIVVVAIALAFLRASLWQWTAAAAALIGGLQWLGGQTSVIPWIIFALIVSPLNIIPLRRIIFSKPLMEWFSSVLPVMSSTEKEAIDAGTVWWDGDLFSGRPDWQKLLDVPESELSEEEQAFIDGPVAELCETLDDWHINNELNDLPEESWECIRNNKFFGMIIPKKYGGLEFSPRAQSEVVMKVASRSLAAGVTIMVPNSLGPGELIMHYGTEKQKDYYLPRLAAGDEIPAFALTSPYAGSDASAMTDYGVVCKGEYEGREVLGFNVNWSKRYITLGPACTILGLAFKARDPDGLLGDEEELGITCALIPTSVPGVRIGDRHNPGGAFLNGPNYGTDVFVPMEWVIGGQQYIGQGWRMLMDCLSVGRAISLPALGAGAGKLCSLTTGAYARIRKQFKTPIGRFEGVEEALTRIAGLTYRMDAARRLTASALALGEKPSVLSAILKYHNTEGMRQCLNDAMDVHGGRAVCGGPRNYLVSTYRTVPVAITVEGSNILTRSMIIFGQGAIRCHPYVLNEMLAVANEDKEQGLRDFDKAIFGHIGFTISNAVRAVMAALTGSRLISAPDIGALTQYQRRLSRMSAAFAFVADVAMLMLGGELKRREKLSARFGDILSHLYFGSAVIKHHEDQGRLPEDLPLALWALEDSLGIIEERLDSILRNFPSPLAGRLMRMLVLPLGRRSMGASDRLGHEVASILLEPSATRDRLTEGLFVSLRKDDPVGRVELAFRKAVDAEPLEIRIRNATGKQVFPYDFEEAVAAGLEAGVITDMEAQLVREAAELVDDALQVDVFPGDAAAEHAEGDVAQAG